MKAVAPGGTIGILGGGQLGRMLALAAARLGLKTHTFCDEADAAAAQVSDAHTIGKFDDTAALTAFANACDAVTLEFENVPAATVAHIASLKPMHPNAKALAITQDRFEEKSFVQSLGLSTAGFVAVDDGHEDVAPFFQKHQRGILKTRRFGYDGKGQAKVGTKEELQAAFKSFKHAPSILESFVDFAFEASVIAARGADGSFAAYDPPQNAHENHIPRTSTVPGRLGAKQGDEAKAIARKIGDALDYVGVFAVELFVLQDGSLVVNEIAPRVHNSGHWTIEACAVSQFEQHIRAIAGWPLGDPKRHTDAVMENILGAEADAWETYARRPGALHLYGKGAARPGRKMGHFTTLKPLTRG